MVLSACGTAGGSGDYPAKPVKLIVPYSAGGSGDPVARQYARQLGKELDTSIVVENREGGSGTIGTNAVVTAPADGYTIGYGHSSPLALQVHRNKDLSYSSTEDYQSIGGFGDEPTAVAVKADAPWADFAAFVDAMRDEPGKRTIAVGGAGNVKDLQLQEFARVSGAEFTTVPFSGGGSEAITAVLGGRADAVAVNPAGLAGLVQSEDLRLLVVFTDEDYTFLPSESIVDAGFDVRLLPDRSGIIAPKGLPAKARDTLLAAHRAVVDSDEFQEFLDQNGYVYVPTDAEEFAGKLKADTDAFAELVEG
ncbi:Bug family tripartite tricarboxylate transporter substrate binding protein [Actinophytocola sediminis]